jgi:hypothetical protein
MVIPNQVNQGILYLYVVLIGNVARRNMNGHFRRIKLICEINTNPQDGDLLVDEDTAGASAGERVVEREHFVRVPYLFW